LLNSELLKPVLETPFPKNGRYWICPNTGLKVPKFEGENLEWRSKLLTNAEDDTGLQRDLFAASRESLIFWINAFSFTHHQFEVDPDTGKRLVSTRPHRPFITWDIQDELFNVLEVCLADNKFTIDPDTKKKIPVPPQDILIDKARDMGASWMCINFLHWLWLFRPQALILEMSRTESYVDQTGNMKALFQKHDYINSWLPEWMVPPDVYFGEKNRTKMHMMNILNGSCIDGESTTEHAGSGDRRIVVLLDEFAKVKHGTLMRSATRDVSPMRIINSTPAGPGTEYARWKQSGQIKVFILPYWEHPEKGANRYVIRNEAGEYEIRSPWFDHEESVRSPQELAREVLRQDLESGSLFFTPITNIDKHIALFAKEPRSRYHIHFKDGVANDKLHRIIQQRDYSKLIVKSGSNGPLRIWTHLIMGRPDQTKSYIFGIDLSKGQGASESVVSIKCKETGEKIAEWRNAITPPYDMARIVAALAIWCGGHKPRCLPFLKWEKNGPGLDFGKLIARIFQYPYFYRTATEGSISDKKKLAYGFHMSRESKYQLLSLYARVLAHGGYINHSKKGLEQAKLYIHYDGGGIGPAFLVEENESARKTHGDIVIADALTLDDSEIPKAKHKGPRAPEGSCGWRKEQRDKKKNSKQGWRVPVSL